MQYPINKKVILIVLFVPLIIFLVWYGWKDSFPSQTSQTNIFQSTPTPPPPTFPPFSPVIEPTTTQNKYQIDYSPKDNVYSITILATPFEENRTLAENALLKKLNISKTQACQLKVDIGMPYFVDKNIHPSFTTFSFCP